VRDAAYEHHRLIHQVTLWDNRLIVAARSRRPGYFARQHRYRTLISQFGGRVRDHILPDAILPDVLEPDLRVIFCGTAASNVSAKVQSYYAHPRNRFWSILSETQLTPRQLKPDEFMLMSGFGYGLPDICKQASGTDSQIPRVTTGQRAALHEKILRHQPRFLAFTSLEAGRRYCGYRVALGLQDARIGRTRLYVLPSTSMNAAWNWNATKHHWHEFAKGVAETSEAAADA
jgi:TDG/mug DNA glycosylase family protein